MEKINLLWFEDKMSSFDRILPKLKTHMLKYEKELVIEDFDHYPDDFDVKMFEGKYSLAFIDLNLNNGQKGVDIINTIRNNGAFIDILLYSNNAEELIFLTEGKNYVEGVFRHATLVGIEKKMIEVLDQIMYKEIMVIHRNNNR